MPFSPIVAAAYAEQYSVTALEAIRLDALKVHANSGTVSRSYEGSSLTIDRENVVEILETVAEALRLKRSKTQGCDGELEAPSRSVSLDRSFHRIR